VKVWSLQHPVHADWFTVMWGADVADPVGVMHVGKPSAGQWAGFTYGLNGRGFTSHFDLVAAECREWGLYKLRGEMVEPVAKRLYQALHDRYACRMLGEPVTVDTSIGKAILQPVEIIL